MTQTDLAAGDRGDLTASEFARLFGDDDRPARMWFGGHAFAVIGDLEPLRQLFEVEGCAVIRLQRDAAGTLRLKMRQVTLYRDSATRTVLQRWRNPYSSANIEVRHEHLPVVEATLGTGTAVPWIGTGARMAVFIDSHAAPHFPLQPAPGADDRRATSCAELTLPREHLRSDHRAGPGYVGGWQLLCDWPAWLGMGAQRGYLFQRCFVRKLSPGEDLPGRLQDEIGQRFADGLDPPAPG
jgi:hypothetical protein